MPQLLTNFQKHIAEAQLLDPKKPILLGLSGGADSVCLLRLLAESSMQVIALHCNFHLRGEESNRDQIFVERLCQEHNIPLHIKDFDTSNYAQQEKLSIEMAARELRYRWFEEMIDQVGAQGIVIAHHKDDQAETLLLNLIRGTGLRGLAAMPPRNGAIIRPLLPFTRQEILDYLTEIHQEYVTDSTNLEREAQRNILRLDIIPLLRQINPQAVSNIASAASRVQEALPYYQSSVQQALKDCMDDEDVVSIVKLMANNSPATLLHEWLHPAGFNAQQIQQMLANIEGESGAQYTTATHTLLRDRGTLVLQETTTCEPPQISIKEVSVPDGQNPIELIKGYPKEKEYAYIDADKLQGEMELRPIQKGMRFHPFGMKGASRLISDFLTDMKMTRFQREQQYVLMDGDNVVWLVGQRSDERYRITSKTQRIVILQVIKL